MIDFQKWGIGDDLKEVFKSSKKVIMAKTRDELVDLSIGGADNKEYEVGYDVDGLGYVVEASVVKCKNGIAVNYPDPYMRRRDPDCLYVNNISKTDKADFSEQFGSDFDKLRNETLEWLKSNELILLPFMAGGAKYGYPALLVSPKNAAFFATSLYDLQESINLEELPEDFSPRAIVYLAPPFRHTQFNGKQAVVHNDNDGIHEIFSYNLYPGPSAKKGIYGMLLSIGVEEGWTTVHASTVKVVTPYDNEIMFLHEGASGSGKSEMLEYAHRSSDGRLILGRNVVTSEKKYLSLGQSCKLYPVTDDMALCHPKFQKKGEKLAVRDAEEGWFIRIDHIKHYGTDPSLENITIHPQKPLVFFNIKGTADATCLIWDHIEDKPGVTCPNPRVIIPRQSVKGIQNHSVEIDYRSFGLRTPPCTRETPSFGIFGLVHILPPALAWLWRLVAPRGYANPSIISGSDLESEGVGSYWPFATGRKVDHANLLLQQIIDTPKTRYTLIPNQHVGIWKVGFMPQWVVREYLARRGQASFKSSKLKAARTPLAGYTINSMQFEGTLVPDMFMEVNKQPEIGDDGYDAGAEILYHFFVDVLKEYLVDDLDPIGRQIIECCINKGSIEDYEKLIPAKY